MLRNLDPMWEYGEPNPIPNSGVVNRQYLTCKFGGKHMSGDVNRLKFHLGQISRQNIELCQNPTPEIIRQTIKSLMDKEEGKDIGAAVKSQLVGASRVGGGSESGSSILLPLNLPGVLGGVPKGLLLNQVATMGQGPTITSFNVPYSLRAFTDGRSRGIGKSLE